MKKYYESVLCAYNRVVIWALGPESLFVVGKCLCTKPGQCDCNKPPPWGWDGTGDYDVSLTCPVHNFSPASNPACPIHPRAKI